MPTSTLGRYNGFAHFAVPYIFIFLIISGITSTYSALGQGTSSKYYIVTAQTTGKWFDLADNETLTIPRNITFTGGVNWNGTNCKVYNNGTWQGNDVNVGSKGAIYTSATSITKLGNINLSDGAVISNLGSLQAGVNWNGTGASITTKGNWTCTGNIPVGQNGTLTIDKEGSISCKDLNLNSAGATVYNWGQLALENCQTSSATTLRNYSNCTVRGHTNNTGKLYNEGYWKCKDYNNNATTNNCGTIEVSNSYHNNGRSLLLNFGKLATHELINDGDVQGPTYGKSVGKVIVDSQWGTQLCRQNGEGKFAVVGRLDLSRCSPGLFSTLLSWLIGINGWDIQTGLLGWYYSYNTNLQTGGCVDQVLPVELVSFTAQVRGTAVGLTWRTSSEKNNDHFVVERSADGRTFQPLSTVPGAGTTSVTTNYTATDAHPLPGISYYRLQQLDLDGSVHYAPIISVQLAATALASAGTLEAYPNPTTDRLTLDLRNLTTGATRAQLRNLAGQLVLEQPVADGTMPELSMAALPTGIYLLQVHTASTTLTQRLVKQ